MERDVRSCLVAQVVVVWNLSDNRCPTDGDKRLTGAVP